MAINLGVLVTLLETKTHPDGERIESGVSGLVVQANPGQDGSILYVIDFGSEGQWNCTEEELSQESQNRGNNHNNIDTSRDPGGNEEILMIPLPGELEKENNKVLSFEDELALLEGE